MPARTARAPSDDRGRHGGSRLHGVSVDAYNLTVRDEDNDRFVGDRVSETGFFEILDRLRRRERTGPDPFGPGRGPKTDKSRVDEVMRGVDPDAAHLVHLAIEEYAQSFAQVVRFFLTQPGWEDVERIVVGGGFHDKSFGAVALRRAARLLKTQRVEPGLQWIENDPDEAGLVGWVHALPPAVARAGATVLAVDIGGTHVRCGLVEHGLRRAADGAKARVVERMQWRHGDDEPTQAELVSRIAAMLNALAAQARTLGMSLAPFVGIACPGRIEEDGSVVQGTQNLPGDWDPPFHLPRQLAGQLDRIEGAAPDVVMLNDAVVQGLSEIHRLDGVRRWGVLTIGTGLGNASFTRR